MRSFDIRTDNSEIILRFSSLVARLQKIEQEIAAMKSRQDALDELMAKLLLTVTSS